MGVINDIGMGPIFIDSCVFIYFIEEDVRYLEAIVPIFEAIDNGRLRAVTSGITLIETLVIPLRTNDIKLAEQYERLITESRGLTCLSLTRDLLRLGAQLRATLGIKTPDALQIAAAKIANCSAFITNDLRLPQISGLQILQLSDY